VAARKTWLFAAIDDHSRALVGYRWALAEDTLRLEAALRAGFAARGLPGVLYVDYADLRIMPTSPRSPCSARVAA
jgi:putative transposase